MQDEQLFLTVVRLWAATAWANGVIAPTEHKLLDGIIRNAKVSDEVRTKALGFLVTPVALEDISVANLGEDERHGVYRTACRLVTVDHRFDEQERAFLARLATHLMIDPDTAAVLLREYQRPLA